MNVVQIDQKNAYKQHRCRVRQAKPTIDDSAPLLHAGIFAGFSKMKEDVETLILRRRENARLLVAMNKIVRIRGVVDSFRTAENSFTPPYSKIQQKHELLQELDMENMKIGKMILCAKPEINCWLDKKFQRKITKKKPQVFQYPSLVMQKYSTIEIPKDILQVKNLLRPKIWLDLDIKDVRPLGRILIELYTEAAPQVVLEFVRFCFTQQHERLQIVRLFPHLWLAATLELDGNTLVSRNIEFDKRSLDHGNDMGILSFNVGNVLCVPKSIISFTISFKPLRVCNGRRVGFGRVSDGLRVLRSIEDYGNKNGKLYKNIIVSSCGLI